MLQALFYGVEATFIQSQMQASTYLFDLETLFQALNQPNQPYLFHVAGGIVFGDIFTICVLLFSLYFS